MTRLGLALVLLTALSCSRTASVQRVIVISIDSLRADHLGCYGYPRDTSPHLDRLAREGARFRTAVSTSSWTLPANMSLLTGLLPGAHGLQRTSSSLDAERTLVSEILHDAGFRTAGFVSSPYLDERYGFARGFDTYRNLWGLRDEARASSSLPRDSTAAADARVYATSHGDRTGENVIDAATSWLRSHESEPFFLFVHLWEPHYDYIPPPPYDTLFVEPGRARALSMEGFYENEAIHAGMAKEDLEYVIAQYDGEIAYTDALIGRFLALLDTLGIAEETFVVVTADHGDEFFEHGGKGHRRTLFDEVILVPLLVRGPGVGPAGRAFDQPISLIDMAPTILSIAGLPRHSEMVGDDLAPLLAGRAHPNGVTHEDSGAVRPAPYTISELERSFVPGMRNFCRWFAVRSARWKTILDCMDTIEVYDLVADPGEMSAVVVAGAGDALPPEAAMSAKSEPVTVGRDLRQAMDRYASALPRKGTRPVRIEKDLEERLRSLGYTE